MARIWGDLRIGAVLAAVLCAAPIIAQAQRNVVNGATSCVLSGCHELASPAAGTNVDRNEHALWSGGPHAQAYRVLLTDQAQRIARNMGVGAPQQAEYCLDCHATDVPEALQGTHFDIAEGVTCESCHGGSGQWLETHTDFDYTIEDLQAQGLYPTWDPVRRAEMCLDCHFGAEGQFAGHRLMGAGHPRVSFELDSYTEINAHHTVDEDYLERKAHVDGMRTWAIGQGMSIARRMELLADSQTGTIGFFPEFVYFDCRGCHQPMSQRRNDLGNGRGQPRLDDSHIRMLRIAAQRADPALAGRIDADLAALHRAATQGRGALVGAAVKMRDTAQSAVDRIARHEFSGQQMREIMRQLAADGAGGRFSDYSSAEQVALALDSTLAAMSQQGEIDDDAYDRMSNALGPVFAAVVDDASYSPPQFASAMQAFRAAIE